MSILDEYVAAWGGCWWGKVYGANLLMSKFMGLVFAQGSWVEEEFVFSFSACHLENMHHYVQRQSKNINQFPLFCTRWLRVHLQFLTLFSSSHHLGPRCVKSTANVCAPTAAAARAWRLLYPPPVKPPPRGPRAATPQAHRWAYLPAYLDATAQQILRWGQITPWGFWIIAVHFQLVSYFRQTH